MRADWGPARTPAPRSSAATAALGMAVFVLAACESRPAGVPEISVEPRRLRVHVVRMAAFDQPADTALQSGMDIIPIGDAILVTDSRADRIVRFDTLLQVSAVIGRKGSGPGELRGPFSLAAGHDALAVMEYSNRRISMFDRQGRFLRTYQAAGRSRAIAISRDGEVAQIIADPRHYLARIDSTGAVVPFGRRSERSTALTDRVHPPESGGGASLIAVSAGDGSMWVFDNADGALLRFDETGALAQELRLPTALRMRLEFERKNSGSMFGLSGAELLDFPLAKALTVSPAGELLLAFTLDDSFGILVDPRTSRGSLLPYPDDSVARDMLRAATGLAIAADSRLLAVRGDQVGIFRLERTP